MSENLYQSKSSNKLYPQQQKDKQFELNGYNQREYKYNNTQTYNDKSIKQKSYNHEYTTRSDDKSVEQKPYNRSNKYPQQQKDRYDDKSYHQQKKDIYVDSYTQQQKFNYDNPRHDDKSYPRHDDKSYPKHDDKSYHRQKTATPAKQTRPRSIYKYKIDIDKSGNRSYVLEEPDNNPIKSINNYEIKCIYPNNGTKYYKNINIYNYKKKIII